MAHIYVYGWYNNGNLGDEAFKDSFRYLWPDHDFTFTSSINKDVNNYDHMIIGGGSFLEQRIPKIETVAIPISFIGVGGCSCPDSKTKLLMDRADRIIFRDMDALKYHSGDRVSAISDLVFARNLKPLGLPKKKKITVFLNDFITPRNGKGSPDWKSVIYTYFLHKFPQQMDRLARDYEVILFPMCINPYIDDHRVAATLVGRSQYPEKYHWLLAEQDELSLRREISESQFVITQRFHGIVYSVIEETPVLTMTMHSKFSSLCNMLGLPLVNYYEYTTKELNELLGDLALPTEKLREYKEKKATEWGELKEGIKIL